MAKPERTLNAPIETLANRIEKGILGGSQAVFFKVNTRGEESFLECLADLLR